MILGLEKVLEVTDQWIVVRGTLVMLTARIFAHRYCIFEIWN